MSDIIVVHLAGGFGHTAAVGLLWQQWNSCQTLLLDPYKLDHPESTILKYFLIQMTH